MIENFIFIILPFNQEYRWHMANYVYKNKQNKTNKQTNKGNGYRYASVVKSKQCYFLYNNLNISNSQVLIGTLET
jgi:hypothetical protein